MTVVETRTRPRLPPLKRATGSASLFGALWLAVIGSRLIVLAAGAISDLLAQPLKGWQGLDPYRVSTHLGSVGNVLAASSVRWDATRYIELAQHGYTSPGSTTLFPMYPTLIHVLTPALGTPVVAGVTISLVSFAIGLALVHRIASEQIGRRAADATVLLLAYAPLSFVFSAAYSASLLFACAAGSLYLASRHRFVLAAIVAAAAALTHVQGIALLPALLFVYWKSRGRPRTLRALWSPAAVALLLPVLALSCFFAYMHGRGYGWLAPITNQNFANAGRTLEGTPLVLIHTLKDIVTGLGQVIQGTALPRGEPWAPGIENVVFLAAFGAAVAALVAAWRYLPREYVLFGAVAIILCSSSAVEFEPLKGFDRYMMPIFPLWIGAAAWLERRRLMPYVLAISAVMLVFETMEFTRWVSVF